MIGANTCKVVNKNKYGRHRCTYRDTHVCNQVGERVTDGEDGQANDGVRKSEDQPKRLFKVNLSRHFKNRMRND